MVSPEGCGPGHTPLGAGAGQWGWNPFAGKGPAAAALSSSQAKEVPAPTQVPLGWLLFPPLGVPGPRDPSVLSRLPPAWALQPQPQLWPIPSDPADPVFLSHLAEFSLPWALSTIRSLCAG